MKNAFDIIKVKVKQIFVKLVSSLWFVPLLVVMLFSLLAVLLLNIDNKNYSILSAYIGLNKEGSTAMLNTIATSMITIAGVVFSITIVALSLTSSQYSSRVLRNFMTDHKNQIVLGVFVGIFSYCLIVLPNIGEKDKAPSLAVSFAIILAFLGVAIFVYFIHHIATSIQASSILANIYLETDKTIDILYPQTLNKEKEDYRDIQFNRENCCNLQSNETGYIQKYDVNALINYALKYEAIIEIVVPIGDFIIKNTPLMSIYSKKSLNKKEISKLYKMILIEKHRTVEQDVAFGLRQIVDVALKALSPGINDSTTAIMCVERLTALLIKLSNRKIFTKNYKVDGQLRLLAISHDFNIFVNEAYNQIRDFGKTNINILSRISWGLENIYNCLEDNNRKEAILTQVDALRETIRLNFSEKYDIELLKNRCKFLYKFNKREESS